MRFIIAFLLFSASLTAQTGFFSFDNALAEAKQEDKNVLLLFSGSDWCKPCIQLKKDIIETEEFKSFASNKLVVLNLDFPYRKKNRLSKEQTKHNETIAEKYNKKGEFPKVVIVDHEGKIVKEVEYNKGLSTKSFIQSIEK